MVIYDKKPLSKMEKLANISVRNGTVIHAKSTPFFWRCEPSLFRLIERKRKGREKRKSLHNLALIPHECVGVEVLGGVEPEVQSLFSVAHTIDINIGLNQVGLPSGVAQELEIKFIVIWSI